MPLEFPDTPSAVAVGPYSPVVRAGDWLVVSGQIGLDPATGGLAEGGTAAETAQILDNLSRLLADVGATLADVAKTTVFLADVGDWPMMNEAYAAAFGDHKPARSAIQAGALPVGARVEIEAWVYKP